MNLIIRHQANVKQALSWAVIKLSCARAVWSPFEADLMFRYWHYADVHTALMNVRFEVNNGHDADLTRCLLMTLSGHLMHVGQSRWRQECAKRFSRS